MIQFNVTEQQADQILNALAQRPFIEVQGLIGVLMQQAQEQQKAKEQQTPQTAPRDYPGPPPLSAVANGCAPN